MTLISTDFVFTLSGGNTNSNPALSLGGNPSVQPILNNRLFPDITPTQTLSGATDYYCFYFHNASDADTLFDASVYTIDINSGGVTVQLGFDVNNERQNITILNAIAVTGGSLILTYTDVDGDHDVVVNWNADYAVWAGNLQTALRTIQNLEDIVVNADPSGSDLSFEIDFIGTAYQRFHDLIAIKTNSLTPATSASSFRTVSGGPINSIADEIDVSTTTPNNTVFSTEIETNAFILGDLRPLDSVPVWVQRTIPAGTPAIENDGYIFRISGNLIA